MMPAAHSTKAESRRLTTAGLIAVTAATLLMLAWAIFPAAAFANGTIVTWNGNGPGTALLAAVQSARTGSCTSSTQTSRVRRLHVGGTKRLDEPQRQ